MVVESNTSGCEFSGGTNILNPSYHSIDSCNAYTSMSGGGNHSYKRNSYKRNIRKKSIRKKSIRKKNSYSKRRPITKKNKNLRKMRIKNMKYNIRNKKRLDDRVIRQNIIKSLNSINTNYLSNKSYKEISPNIKKFIDEIKSTSNLTLSNDLPEFERDNKGLQKKISTSKFNKARKELQKKINKGNKSNKKLTPSQLSFLKGIKSKSNSNSSSILKFSDFKSISSNKKSKKSKKSKKKKGNTR
tara:strand:- start:176 stop:904 length:729 start_codon:yes stop_codon:yes gene_type:complete